MTQSPMGDRELLAVVMAEVRDSVGYLGTQSSISSERADALNYYLGRPFGDERDGRSKVVSRDVADTVEWILPSLLRVFTAGDEAVRFEPQGPEDEPYAEQATDYVNHVFYKDNPGFLTLYSWFKDALIQKTGVIKYWWDDAERTVTESYSGLTEEEVLAFVADPAVTILSHESDLDEATGITFQNLRIKRVVSEGRVRIEPVPPEEFLISRRARSLEDATFVGHRVFKTRSELVAAGYDKKTVDALPVWHRGTDDTEEGLVRWADMDAGGPSSLDPAMQTVEVIEGYLPIDADKDGIAELMKVTVAGADGGMLLDKEPVDAIPFATLCPIPMPHRFFGLSVADLVMDLQRIKSVLWRQMLDNLYLTNNPQREVVTAMLDKGGLDDLLNSKVGGIIRAKQSGAVRELPVPHSAAASFPMLEYVDRVRSIRTGVSPTTTGIDAGALQNQTATAVNQAAAAANQRIELIARIFAETGVKDLFHGLLRLITQHQDKARTIRLRGKWVPVTPALWQSDMDVTVEVGLGHGTRDQQLAALTQVLGVQKEAMAAGGMGLVTPKQLYNTLTKLVEWAGLKSPGPYFTDPDLNPPPLPPAPQPDPTTQALMAQIQLAKEKAAADIEIKQGQALADVELDRFKAETKLANEMSVQQQKLNADLALKQQEFEAELALEQAKLAGTPNAPDADGNLPPVT